MMKRFFLTPIFILAATFVNAQNSKAFEHLEKVVLQLSSIDNFKKHMGKLISDENGLKLYAYTNPDVKSDLISDYFVGKDQYGGLYIEYIKPEYTSDFIKAITTDYPKNEPGTSYIKKDSDDKKFTVYTLTYQGSPVLDIIDYKDPKQKDALNIFLSDL